MATKIRKQHCVIFKRSDSEKRIWQLGKEVTEQRSEIDLLKAEIAELKKSEKSSS